MSRQDVEKSWHDPQTGRKAVRFCIEVIVIVAVVVGLTLAWALTAHGDECADAEFAVCASPDRYILAIVPTAILLGGGIIAFVHSYRLYRAGGAWPIWQGAGWFLFVLMLVYVGLSATALLTG